MQQTKVLFTDGEGPLVFKDLASDLMGRITFESQGRKIQGADFFELLSLYDDYLAEKGTEGYQAGDTLALVVPHFLHHGTTDEDVRQEAEGTQVCFGVKEYINDLKRDGYEVRVTSTAYSQMWELVGNYLGIPQEHIACTKLDLKTLREKHQTSQFDEVVEKMEQEVLPMLPWVAKMKEEIDKGRSVVEVFDDQNYASLPDRLDRFYWQELKELDYKVLSNVEVIGGNRKIEAARRFAAGLNLETFASVAYGGDSITDDALNIAIRKEGGLPIAINANFYALRHARVAVATIDMRNIRPVLNAWYEGGFRSVEKFIEVSQAARLVGKERTPVPVEERGPYYHLLEGVSVKEREGVLDIHKIFRKAVRGAAADLG